MPRRRLCFVGWADHVHLERWAGYFARHGDQVDVISMSRPGRYPPGVAQHGLGWRGSGPHWDRWHLRYLLWRLRPALVHVHWGHFAPIVRRVWKGPLVVTIWGSDVYRREQYSVSEWAALGDALRTADLVTCDSEDLAGVIRREFALPEARVRVIQWGVDTDAFCDKGKNLREHLGLGDRKVVYSARNFTPVYNQETIVRAFGLLRERRPDAFLLMKNYGGDREYLESIRNLIEELGLVEHVRVLDSVAYEEMPAVYRSADVTVSVPHSDAMPMSVLEAMASGSIAVVGDLPSLREWIDPDRTGYLVDASSPEAIASTIEQALQAGPASDRIRANARQRVEERASQHVHMALAGEHYDRLIASDHQRKADAGARAEHGQ